MSKVLEDDLRVSVEAPLAAARLPASTALDRVLITVAACSVGVPLHVNCNLIGYSQQQ